MTVLERFLRFGGVGATGVVINVGFLHLLKLAGVDFDVAHALSIEASILWNFLLNSLWTFRDRNATAHDGLGERLLSYHLVAGVGGVIQYLTTRIVLALELGPPPGTPGFGYVELAAVLLGIAMGMTWNFSVNYRWTWRSRAASDTPPQAGAGSP